MVRKPKMFAIRSYLKQAIESSDRKAEEVELRQAYIQSYVYQPIAHNHPRLSPNPTSAHGSCKSSSTIMSTAFATITHLRHILYFFPELICSVLLQIPHQRTLTIKPRLAAGDGHTHSYPTHPNASGVPRSCPSMPSASPSPVDERSSSPRPARAWRTHRCSHNPIISKAIRRP